MISSGKEHDERLRVAEAMQTYGGSFVKSLGVALLHADRENTRRVKQTWPEYWQKYLNMHRRPIIRKETY